jgi:hypothetical protein
VRRCTGGVSRAISRTESCYQSAATAGAAGKQALHDGEVATQIVWAVSAAGCFVAAAIAAWPALEAAGRAICAVEVVAATAADTIAGLVDAEREAAWFRGAWTTGAATHVAAVADEVADHAGDVVVTVVEETPGVYIVTEDDAEAAAATGQSIVDQIKAGVISAADAIRAGLISCEEAKDAGLYPRELLCP